MITRKGRFLIRYEEVDAEYLSSFDFDKLEVEYQNMKKFFLYEKDLDTIRICFLYSPEEFLFFTGKEFGQNWMCAMVGYHSTINIFSPSVIDDITVHTKESIPKTLSHEMSHLFYGYSGLVDLPLFNEGIAKYHGDNNCDNRIGFDVPSLRGGKDTGYDYGVGHLMVCSIMEHFGDSGAGKIMEFLKGVSPQMEEGELFDLFNGVFGEGVDSLIKLKGGRK